MIPTVRISAVFAVLVSVLPVAAPARAQDLREAIGPAAAAVADQVIAWRRDIHAHPELGNREFRTSKIVAAQLRKLGLEVRKGIAHTGVVAILRGALPGPTVALRADMDALPVTEQTGLPFASHVTTEYKGQETGVMHACGHDAHTAMLLGTASVLSGMRARLPGSVMFIFQPAEEGVPDGEEGGAKLMLEEGLFDGPDKPAAVFGLHVFPLPVGEIDYRPGAILAAADELTITVHGRGTHGSLPWRGVDPITVSAQILLALQTIPSRQIDIIKAPAVISAGSIRGGNRGNVIPDDVTIEGTIRTFDREMRDDIHARIRRTVEDIAHSAGATAEVRIDAYAPVTYNDPALTQSMVPSLEWAAGADKVKQALPLPGAEDFSLYAERVPGMYVFLGVNKPGVGPWDAAPNHSPLFYVNEDALVTGVRALSALAVDYLQNAAH